LPGGVSAHPVAAKKGNSFSVVIAVMQLADHGAKAACKWFCEKKF
jgi:hypothetical protein